LLRQTSSSGPAQRACDLLQGYGQSARAPGIPLHGFRQTLREYLLAAVSVIAKEPTHAQFDPHRNPFPWQITQPSPVTAVDAL
jgi:hypothetical protein